MPEGLREKRGVTVHSVPSNTLRGAQKRQKTPFRVAILGFSVTSAALHSQKTPRGILPVNSNRGAAIKHRGGDWPCNEWGQRGMMGG
ncbi:hypothetical protein F220043C3_36510 [Enterocloster asparagiformis]